MRLTVTLKPKRPLFSIALAAVSVATVLVFPTAAAAQIRARISPRNSFLSRYVPVHFKPQVRSGRITGTSLRHNFLQKDSLGESLTIKSDDSTGKIELEYEGPFREGPSREGLRTDGKPRTGRLSLLLDTAARLEIELAFDDPSKINAAKKTAKKNLSESNRTKSDRTVAMRFIQRPGHRLTLELGIGSQKRIIQTATIWELLIGHREDCCKHLLPILYKLRPAWNLLGTANQVEEHLLRLAEENTPPEYARWQELVEQLGHDSYSHREAADKELRVAGRRALTFLRKIGTTKLDGQKLDVEQRFRIARIVSSFECIEQSPREIAEEIRDDPSIWLAVAANKREPARHAAWAELKRLLKHPIDFDPKAQPQTREAQLRKIGKSIAGE